MIDGSVLDYISTAWPPETIRFSVSKFVNVAYDLSAWCSVMFGMSLFEMVDYMTVEEFRLRLVMVAESIVNVTVRRYWSMDKALIAGSSKVIEKSSLCANSI